MINHCPDEIYFIETDTIFIYDLTDDGSIQSFID